MPLGGRPSFQVRLRMPVNGRGRFYSEGNRRISRRDPPAARDSPSEVIPFCTHRGGQWTVNRRNQVLEIPGQPRDRPGPHNSVVQPAHPASPLKSQEKVAHLAHSTEQEPPLSKYLC